MASFGTFPLVVLLLCALVPCRGEITCFKKGAEPVDCTDGHVCRLGPQGELLEDPCGTLQIDCGSGNLTDKVLKCDPGVGCCCKDSNCNDPKNFSREENTKELCKLNKVPEGVSCPTEPTATNVTTGPPQVNFTNPHHLIKEVAMEHDAAAEGRAAQEAMNTEKSGCNSVWKTKSLWTLAMTVGVVAFAF